MTLEKLLEDREVWQKNTIEEIRKRIIYKSSIKNVSGRGEKLVAIYGPPQIGKTTLILQLIGIESRFQKQVYDVIRAGVPKGNSSTSTAIIYQRIDSELYGIKWGDGLSNIEFCSEADLQSKIKEVRDKVEKETASKEILHIYIPSKFFSESVILEEGINIVDLPGEGSRNIKEKTHVDAVIAKYLALANVNIIACKSNEIQSLQELILPINVDWRNLPHKYIVVITNAFGMGTIKKYFRTKKEERQKNFYEYVKEAYSKDMAKILNVCLQIEYFPIDIGNSFNQLLFDCNLDQNEQNEVKNVVKQITQEIRNAIQQRHGNSLKSTLLDLRAFSSEYAQSQSEELKRKLDEFEEKKKRIQHDNKMKSAIIERCNNAIVDLQEYYDQYRRLMKYQIIIDWEMISEIFASKITIYSNKGRIKDTKHCLLFEMREILSSQIINILNNYELDSNENEANVLYETINMDIALEASFGEKVYKGGWFFRAVKTEECIEFSDSLIQDFCKQLEIIVTSKIKEKRKKLKTDHDEYERYRQWKVECERNIYNNESKLIYLDAEMKKCEDEVSAIEIRKKADSQLIEDYLYIANQEFNKYIQIMLERLDSEKLSSHEKALILIYLCMIEKDYKSIAEMG